MSGIFAKSNFKRGSQNERPFRVSSAYALHYCRLIIFLNLYRLLTTNDRKWGFIAFEDFLVSLNLTGGIEGNNIQENSKNGSAQIDGSYKT